MPIWGMTPTERTRFEKQFQTTAKGADKESLTDEFRERVVAACCRNDDGSYVFTADQVSRLGAAHGGMVERLFNAAAKASGITDADAEEAVKNSEGTTIGS